MVSLVRRCEVTDFESTYFEVAEAPDEATKWKIVANWRGGDQALLEGFRKLAQQMRNQVSR